MTYYSDRTEIFQAEDLSYPVRPSQMFISAFVTQEPVTFFSRLKLRVLSIQNRARLILGYASYLLIIIKYAFLFKNKLESSAATRLPSVSHLQGLKAWHDEQNLYHENKEKLGCVKPFAESWPHQTIFDQVRQSKLTSFTGLQILAKLPISTLSQFIKRADEKGYRLQYAGLALLSLPALIQLGFDPILSSKGKNDLLNDVVHTSSILQKVEPAPKKNIWASNWKVKSGKPLQIFSVEAPETSDLNLSYTTKIHVTGLQEDVMNWTDTSFKSITASMIIQRNMPPQGYDSQGIYQEMTQRVTALGYTLEKVSVLSTVPSKFGPVEVIDMTIIDSAQSERTCSAFRTQAHQPNLKLSGWLCSDTHGAVERPQVTCFINRLDLLGAQETAPLRQIFLNAETRKGDCPSRGIYVQNSTKKANWLEIKGSLPTLKGAL